MPPSSQALLEVDELHVSYGRIRALQGVSLAVPDGSVVALIGANGAGKSTLLRAISGIVRPRRGAVRFLGENLVGLPVHQIVRRRVVHVPEGRGMLARMTVLENLRIGGFARRDGAEKARELERVFALFPVLEQRRGQLAGSLSGGEQQMLAIGRALMGNPRVLLMDEPSEGLAPQLVAEVGRTIAQLKAEGQSIVLVEQNIKLTLDLADDVVIINTGRVVFRGAADRLKLDDAIVSQHLGVF
jgi:branched-chain amino acid transport system ATP-binding protein